MLVKGRLQMAKFGLEQRKNKAYELYFKYKGNSTIATLVSTIALEADESAASIKSWIYTDKWKERAEREHLTISSGVTDAITKKVIGHYDGLLNDLQPILTKFIKDAKKGKYPIDNYKTFNETANTYIKMVESLKNDGKQSGNTTIYVISNTPRPGRLEEQNIIEISANTQAEISSSSDGT